MMEDYHIRESKCLNCGEAMDCAAPIGGGRGPQSGDIALCADCGHLQAYGEELALRELTDDEVVEVAGDPEIILGMKMISSWKKEQNNAKASSKHSSSGRNRG